jgi:hypothetical protein
MAKRKFKSTSVIPRSPGLFGTPLLLVGEDAAEYDELHAGIRAAVNPIDTVDEMFVADVVALEWEVLRWRRLKSALLSLCLCEALEEFLDDRLHYDQYAEDFEDELARTLEDNLLSARMCPE